MAGSITVVLDFEHPPSSASLEAMHQELDRILAPAGVKIDVQVKSELPQRLEETWRRLSKMRKVDALSFLASAAAVLVVNAVLAVAIGCSFYLLRYVWGWMQRHMGRQAYRPSAGQIPAMHDR